MITELHSRYFKPGLVNAKVGARATEGYSGSAITKKIIGWYDDRNTRSFFPPKR